MIEFGHIPQNSNSHSITNADTETQNRENLIKIYFNAQKSLRKLLINITDVQWADRKLYVSPICDNFADAIVTLEMLNNMKKFCKGNA